MRFGLRSILPLLVVLALFLSAFFVYQAKVFSVRKILCQTDHGDCPDYVQAELNTHLGESLFFTDFPQYGEEITRLAPFLASFELQKEFPDTVIYRFSSAEPKYRYVESDGRTWLVDSAGYVIGLADDTQTTYPAVTASITVEFHPDVRERIDPTLHQQILNVWETLRLQSLNESQFFLLNQKDGYLILPDGKRAYFTLAQAPAQLAKLSYLLKHFTFSTVKEPIAEIDLRFSQVILRNHLSTASAAAEVTP